MRDQPARKQRYTRWRHRHRRQRFADAQQGVTLLLSPPDTPRYNGACQAGLGALKTRTDHLAARDGDPATWTCNQVEAARLQAKLRRSHASTPTMT
jgi:hypothetical protein